MTKDHAYLYLSSLSEAKRQNEVALWRRLRIVPGVSDSFAADFTSV